MLGIVGFVLDGIGGGEGEQRRWLVYILKEGVEGREEAVWVVVVSRYGVVWRWLRKYCMRQRTSSLAETSLAFC